jgi:methyl-accepting chemotaxis protein
MLKNIRIGNRLFIGYVILLALLIAVSVFAIIQMNFLAHFTRGLYDHSLAVGNAARDAQINVIKMHRSMKDVALSINGTEFEDAVKKVTQYEKIVNKMLDRVKKATLNENADIDNLKIRFAQWKPIREKVIRLTQENKMSEAAAITKGEGSIYMEGLLNEMQELIDFSTEQAQDYLETALKSKSRSDKIVAIIVGISILLSILVGYLITRSITKPVAIAGNVAGRLAKGDLSVDVEEYSKDELGNMLKSMKIMSETLRTQMTELIGGISVLAGSTSEISTTTAQLATTTQEVATSVSQVVVSMKEVKQTTELSNEKAREMAERSRGVVQTSRDGESAVRETIDMINTIQEQMISIAESVVGLSEQSQSIGEIIAAVDDVADQSRLLAVNASIEAVKAGEQGKGFTVVADEIKNLAEQSKQSTSQVRTILTDIQKGTSAAVMATEKGSKAVENGVNQADQTGGAIQALGESINQTSQSAIQIEATSRQQSAGIDQVFAAMESIKNAMEQNAESARQLEQSAGDLDELGRKIKIIVEKYKL